MMDFARPILRANSLFVRRDRGSLPQFENLRTLRALAEKRRESSRCHNFGAWAPNKARKKFPVGSGRWLRSAEFLGFAPRGELKKPVSLVFRDVNR
jgi:hypothetical protein